MKEANKKFLEDNRNCYTEILQAQTATRANKIKYDLLRILQEEFVEGYVITFDCGSCLFDMVKLLYQRFDKWIAEQPKEKEQIPLEKVHATFPKHNKNHHRK